MDFNGAVGEEQKGLRADRWVVWHRLYCSFKICEFLAFIDHGEDSSLAREAYE